MKKLLIATMLLTSSLSFAEVINCKFTEPFVTLSYNTATETLVEKSNEVKRPNIVKNVSFQIKSAGTFLLKNKSGKLLVELKLNNQGNDGASDEIYPYAAINYAVFGSQQTVEGGCTSSLRPIVK